MPIKRLIMLDIFRRHARLRLVNPEVARIFKGGLESWNRGKSGKKFASLRRHKIGEPRVYHVRINHDSRLREIDGPLMRALNAPAVPPRQSISGLHCPRGRNLPSGFRLPRPRWGDAGIEAENGDARSASHRRSYLRRAPFGFEPGMSKLARDPFQTLCSDFARWLALLSPRG